MGLQPRDVSRRGRVPTVGLTGTLACRVAFGALMKARYKTGAMGTYRSCQGDISEHYESRALDWMPSLNNPAQKAIANSVTTWRRMTGRQPARALRPASSAHAACL